MLPEKLVKSVLIVEDDEGIRETLRELVEMEGFQVIEARNGKQALDLIRCHSFQPELILLDLMMPVMNGWEFLKELHSDTSDPKAAIPIVIVSAAADSVFGLREKVQEFVRKPVEIETLVGVLHRMLA
jgi:CheY-like chemotaxis protein